MKQYTRCTILKRKSHCRYTKTINLSKICIHAQQCGCCSADKRLIIARISSLESTRLPFLSHAALTVYVAVPPEQPEIVGYRNGSVVRVSDKLVPLNLTCRAAAAKPAATLNWLRNGVDLSVDNAGVAYSTLESTVSHKLRDAESVLTFTPSDDDNEAYYSCTAHNDALQRPYTVTVQLGVLRQFTPS